MRSPFLFLLLFLYASDACALNDSNRCSNISHTYVYKPAFNDYYHHLTLADFTELIEIPGFEKFLPEDYVGEFSQQAGFANLYSFGIPINKCSSNNIEWNISLGFLTGKSFWIKLPPAILLGTDTTVSASSHMNADVREIILGTRLLHFAKELYRFRLFMGANLWSSAMIFNHGFIVSTEDKYYNNQSYRTILKGDLKLKRNYSIHASMPAGITIRIRKGLSITGEAELGLGFAKFQQQQALLKTFASAGFGVRYEIDKPRFVHVYKHKPSPRFSLRMSAGFQFFNDRKYTEKDYYSILKNQDSIPATFNGYTPHSHRYAGKVFNLGFGAFLPLKRYPRLFELNLSAGYMYGKKFFTRYSFLIDGIEDTLYSNSYHSRRDYILLGSGLNINFPSRRATNFFLGFRYQYALSVFASSITDSSRYITPYYTSEYSGNYRGEGVEDPFDRKSLAKGSNALPSFQVNYLIPVGLCIKPGDYVSMNFVFFMGFGFEKVQYHQVERRTLIGLEFNLAHEF